MSNKQNNNAYLTLNTFILIVGIIFIVLAGIYFYNQYKDVQKQKKNSEYLKMIPNDCPDYWEIISVDKNKNGDISKVKCKNTHKLGVCAIQPTRDTFTFDDDIFINPKTKDIARCNWAKQCKLHWSGYDNLCVA
jgi:hypothetical protein